MPILEYLDKNRDTLPTPFIDTVRKVERVINSCETYDQLDVATEFLILAGKRLRQFGGTVRAFYPGVWIALGFELDRRGDYIKKRYKAISMHSCHVCQMEY